MATSENNNAAGQEKNNQEADYTPSEKKVQALVKYMIIGGLLMLFLINISHFWGGTIAWNDRIASALTTLGNGLLIAGACFGAGALVGFLFGIPRLLENKNGEAQGGLAQNDNLVQISDWLTKIIVGVGLTQITQIWPGLEFLGKTFAITFGDGPVGKNLAIGTILYFVITGFLSGYLWTRIHFYRLLAQTSGDVKALEKQLNEANEQKAQAEAEKEEAEKQRIAMEEQKQKAEAEMEEAKKNELKKQKQMEALADAGPEPDMLKTESQFISDDNNDDPHAGQFGGKAEVNGRKIEAHVEETPFDPNRFFVELEVFSTDNNKPLEGEVKIFLHPTYRNPERVLPVINGRVDLHLVAWGSYTVGVECDNGQTKLELDLSKIPGVPQKFAER
jgi:hypothetical protein